MKLTADHNKILEYLQKYNKANTFRLSRHLNIDRVKLISIIEELTKEGLTEFKSNVAKRIGKIKPEKRDENLQILANKTLADVNSAYEFYFCNGLRIKNLQELLLALGTIDDNIYQYHANDEKNDFSNWIKDILGDEELASNLKLKGKEEAINILNDRIETLKGY